MGDLAQRLENHKLLNAVFGKCSKIFKMIIIGLMVFIWGYLSVSSLLETTRIELADPTLELSTYNRDGLIFNIIFLVCIFIILKNFFRGAIKSINTNTFALILSLYTLALGLFWVLSVKSTAMHDSYMITSTAEAFLKGDYSILQFDNEKYFYEYPFQLGYVLVCEIVNIFFKDNNYLIALQVSNVISLVFIFLGVIQATKYIFKNKEVTNTTILLLFGFVAIILFTTFIYGNLLGFALSTWAVVLELKYIRTDKKYLMVISAVLIGLSIMVKSNNMIVLMAMCIVLLIKFLDTKKLWDIVSIVICVVVGLNILNCVIGYYENKADVDLGSGIPKILWLNMGLHESSGRACGWYNYAYTVSVFENNNYDSELSAQEGIGQIKEQLQYFYNNQNYMNKFFAEKILSQWNEPSFDSIWVSQVRDHIEATPEYVDQVYEGKAGEVILLFMNQYQQVLYIFAFVGLFAMFKKKDVSYCVLPLVILGGFMYHLLFEAKAQYVITYVVLLIPLGAYGFNLLQDVPFWSKFKKWLSLGASKD